MINPPIIALQTLLSPAYIRVQLAGADKAGVINNMVDLLADHPAMQDLETVRAAVLQREARLSTGLGNGVALPHARADVIQDPIAAFAVTAEPVDFEALDGEPVRLVFLLISPAQVPGLHLRLLGRVSRVLSNPAVRQRLLKAQTPEAVQAAFDE